MKPPHDYEQKGSGSHQASKAKNGNRSNTRMKPSDVKLLDRVFIVACAANAILQFTLPESIARVWGAFAWIAAGIFSYSSAKAAAICTELLERRAADKSK